MSRYGRSPGSRRLAAAPAGAVPRVLVGRLDPHQPGPRGARRARGPARHDRAGGMDRRSAVVYLVWIVGLTVGDASGLFDRLGFHYQAYDRPSRPTRRERRRRRAGMKYRRLAAAGQPRRAEREAARKTARTDAPPQAARRAGAACPAERRVEAERRVRAKRRCERHHERRRRSHDGPAHDRRRQRRGRRDRQRKAVVLARIAKASVERVVAAADMLEVVGQYTQLKKAGANYMGRCPFHEEKTPSFSRRSGREALLLLRLRRGRRPALVRREEGEPRLRRGGRGAGRPLRRAARVRGGERPGRRRPRAPRPPAQAARAHLRLLRARARGRRGRRKPPAPTSPRAASARRSAASTAWASRCRAGATCAMPPPRRASASASSPTPAWSWPGKRGGVYDRFRGRLMFPLADERGRVLGFGARTLGDDKPKYLNSPETPLYHKSEALFGLDKAKASAAQAGPPVRGGGLHRRRRPRAGRRDQRGRLDGHRLHRGAAQAPHAPHAQPVPVLRRRRRRPGRHEPRARAGPAGREPP